MNLRSGQRWLNLANKYRHRCKMANAPCWLCKQPINYQLKKPSPWAFQVDHFHPVSERPDLVYNETWFRPSHAKCNGSRGNKPIEPRPWVAANW